MNGMEMMFKALGVNPEEIRRQIEEPISMMLKGVQNIGARLAQIDARLERIERVLNIKSVPLIEILPPEESEERKRA